MRLEAKYSPALKWWWIEACFPCKKKLKRSRILIISMELLAIMY